MNLTAPDLPHVSVLTPRGRGAVAVIELYGNLDRLEQAARAEGLVWFEARNGRSLADQSLNRIVFGCWGDEELVVCRTDEQRVEVQCHGGRFAVARILADAKAAGATEVRWTEASPDFRADYLDALSRSVTERAAGFLLHQLSLGENFWRAEQLQQLDVDNLAECRCWQKFGSRLTQPWDVVVGGPPNVGKSSLINRLVGYERAIVFNQPGTTRDVVSVETAIDGWPVSLSDTAGQRGTADELEARGIEQAVKALQRADLKIVAIDQSQPCDEFTHELIQRFPAALLVLHKADLPRHESWSSTAIEDALSVSSKTDEGVRELINAISARLVPELPSEHVVYPVTLRQEESLNAEFNRRGLD
ncbi:GTPase [Rubinisphaera margarita]|uniref:GTPase n=1 Tax=Rubinisphaera margarita TaxID=2909586 RepID=UPI001EE89A28|nr:GTPase [Rubinisphaera margarita]MCG6156211.1 50S ribosome-binding GTPase [Rubinisphaera margarita]